ncbi:MULTISPECIES: phage tail assembly protein [unclassified Aeromicrobium]|uniref:phage tail assembly protein n=1 Tax=unclassified Aeromicrobium TaxID=2633570 RepID=UPI00288B276F|nr:MULTISPECIES: phage tail assembly protein [unclassified Aeromicrobium]
MTRTITLDDIATRVDELYGPVRIPLPDDSYALLHPIMRLTQAERTEFSSKQGEMSALQDKADAIQDSIENGDDDSEKNLTDAEREEARAAAEAEAERLQEEILEILRDLFRIVGRRTVHIEKLLEHFGDDFATLMTAFQMYAKDTQAGEASASPAS